jgi:ankyrin repeat protein
MFEQQLPPRPNLEQYKKQAKEIVRSVADPAHSDRAESLQRFKRNHPRFHKLSEDELNAATCSLAEAQLILAREHGFQSWPKFAHHIEMQALIESVANLADPVSAFLEVAVIPRHMDHTSGSLDHPQLILERYPQAAAANIYTAVVLADEAGVRNIVATDPTAASKPGGPLNWDPLTYLCFSRYLRLDKSRSDAFLATARVLIEAGAPAQSGWYETIDQPNPRQILESTIYGAAAVGQHAGLAKLLLDHGADPNDEETAYHVPETNDNTVMEVMLKTGKFNARSLGWLLVRKADWHDGAGLKMALEYGADPNLNLRWGGNAFQHCLRRDNGIDMIKLMLDHGGDPDLRSVHERWSVTDFAARRGRRDVLELLRERGIPIRLEGVNKLIGACALGDDVAIRAIMKTEPMLREELLSARELYGGMALAEFAANDNADGVRCLLDLGVSPGALHGRGDGYWSVVKDDTALHYAAWRAAHTVVVLLVERGAPVELRDSQGRTPLMLAVSAAVDSYWTRKRKPDSVAALLRAGASTAGIDLPTGYDAIDSLLTEARAHEKTS